MQRHDYPYDIYTKEYFNGNKNEFSKKYGVSHDKLFAKIQDEFAAICYAFGVAKTYEEVERLLGLEYAQSLLFPGELRARPHRGILPQDWIGLYDSVYKKGWNYKDQLALIRQNVGFTKPRGVIDFGGGKGFLSNLLSAMDTNVLYVDPYGIEKNHEFPQERIRSVEFFDEVEDKILEEYDTLVFCASIEHVPEEYSMDIIRRCKGKRLIVVNTITYHPIAASGREHCTRIDDSFYDKICSLASSVVYRQGSHLICEI